MIENLEENNKNQGQELLKVPQLIQIGSSGRNSGKTTLAVRLINQWKEVLPIIGIKIVTIQQKNGKCPRGGAGCGTCTNITGDYELTREDGLISQKDTSLMLQAGCKEVYFLRAMKTHLPEAFRLFLRNIPENHLIICESNTLRKHVEPGLFVFLHNTSGQIKPAAQEVMEMADITLKDREVFPMERLKIASVDYRITISCGGEQRSES